MNSKKLDIIHPEYSFKFPRRQYFSLPYYLISYITERPSSSALGYQKLQKTCKYFFSKKKIVVFNKDVALNSGYFHYVTPVTYENYKKLKLKLNFNDFQFWLTDNLVFQKPKQLPLLKHIFRNDLVSFKIYSVDMTFNEIKFLLNSGRIKVVTLSSLNFTHADGTPVTLDLFMKECPKIEELNYYNRCEIFTSNTFEKITLNFQVIWLNIGIYHMEEMIDPEIFCQFVERNLEKPSVCIDFKCVVPSESFNNFESIVRKKLANTADFLLVRKSRFI